MKRIITILLSLAAAGIFAQTPSNINQSLSVNQTGTAADASAQLDVSATDKGMLVPRMTTAQRTAIASPATGLLVFDTDLPGFWVFNGTIWVGVSKTYVAGTGISVAGTTISNTGDTNAADDITTANAAGGDLTGTYPNPTVGANAIGSAEVTDASITAADLAAGVIPTTLPPSGAAGGDLTGTYPNPTVGANAIGSSEITDASIGAADLAPGVIPTTLPPSGAAGGDLTGTYPNPTVGANAIGSSEITDASITIADLNFGAAAANQVLTATGATTAAWQAQAPAVPKTIADADNNTKVQVEKNPNEDIIRFDLGGTENMVLRKNANGVPRLELVNTGFHTYTGVDAGILTESWAGNSNTAYGYQAFDNSPDNFSSTAIGRDALGNSTIIGDGSTATGRNAMLNATTGNGTAMGYNALTTTTFGRYNTALGSSADVTGTGVYYATALGYNAKVNADYKVRIGNTTVAVIEGEVPYTFPSDARFKFNIHDEGLPGLAFIEKLRPVTYQFDTRKFDEHLMQNMPESIRQQHLAGQDYSKSTATVQTGFLAQEVEQVCKDLNFQFNGLHVPESGVDNYGLAYESFVPLLVKAVQERQAIIAAQWAENRALKMEVEALSAEFDNITAALAGAGISVEK